MFVFIKYQLGILVTLQSLIIKTINTKQIEKTLNDTKKEVHDNLFTRFVVFFNGNQMKTLRQLIVSIQIESMNDYLYKFDVAGL